MIKFTTKVNFQGSEMRPGLAFREGGGTDALSELYVEKDQTGKSPAPGVELLFIPDPGGGWFVKQIMNFKSFRNSKCCFNS